jgi:hypothetical protein
MGMKILERCRVTYGEMEDNIAMDGGGKKNLRVRFYDMLTTVFQQE